MKTLLAALAFLVAPAFALASPITFGFTGTTNLGPFSGSYTFDSEGTGELTADQSTRYFFSGGPYGMTINVGALSFSLPLLEIRLANDQVTGQSMAQSPLADWYFVRGSDGNSGFGSFAQFFLHDCFGTALDSGDLPLTPPNVSLFRPSCSPGDEVVIHGPGIPNIATGTLTSLFDEKIPEPASWLLFGFGLMGIVMGGERYPAIAGFLHSRARSFTIILRSTKEKRPNGSGDQ